MVAVADFLEKWEGSIDDDGHREYKAWWQVRTTSITDGPASALTAVGLPNPGVMWSFGSDIDAWAFCRPQRTAQSKNPGEPCDLWTVTQLFTTKPFNRCQDSRIENPLLERPKRSGGFSKFTREAKEDRHGDPLRNMAHEPLRGSIVEREDNRPTVRLSINTAYLPLAQFAPAIDTVNDAPMWGLGPRKIRLANVSWSVQWYGTCFEYYTTDYEFEVNYKGWDRRVPSFGRMCLMGHSPGTMVKPALDPLATEGGVPHYLNPKKFEVYKDKGSENAECYHDQYGRPAATLADRHIMTLEFYEETNFALWGIPSVLS